MGERTAYTPSNASLDGPSKLSSENHPVKQKEIIHLSLNPHSGDEHQDWDDSQYSELEDEEAQESTAEGHITISQYLNVLRKKCLMPQVISLHEAIEVKYMCICMSLYDVCIYVCVYIHMHTCMHTCVCNIMCVCVCVCIYIYI